MGIARFSALLRIQDGAQCGKKKHFRNHIMIFVFKLLSSFTAVKKGRGKVQCKEKQSIQLGATYLRRGLSWYNRDKACGACWGSEAFLYCGVVWWQWLNICCSSLLQVGDGRRKVLCSIARVAPLQRLSTPRVALNGAVVGVRLLWSLEVEEGWVNL